MNGSIARNGVSSEEADRRIFAQPPAIEKIDRADVVIENDGTLAELREAVRDAWMHSGAAAVSG